MANIVARRKAWQAGLSDASFRGYQGRKRIEAAMNKPAAPEIDSPISAGLSPARLMRLEATLQRQIDAGHLPGVTMAISRRGKLAYAKSLGALRPAGPRMRPDAIFRIYSMTKPIVSAALMMLVEEGRVLISDPLSKYLPEFADVKVGVESGGKLKLVPAERAITLQDLLRHTSGLSYGFTGESLVHKRYQKAPLYGADVDSAAHVAALARLPLIAQPGTAWHYSHSTDVIGRVIEAISGQKLGAHLYEKIFSPLGMVDTGFFAPEASHDRLAEPFETDPDTGAAVKLINARVAPSFESGGGGLVSTVTDYLRFMHLFYNNGALDGVRLLGRRTIIHMTSDHLGADITIDRNLLPGHGFGLGFAVRLATGMAPSAGAAGEYFWGGAAGTSFWIAPQEELAAIILIQAPGQRDYYRQLFRNLVYAALV
jgi:CubicO group peptidase (beta-lactamase class C family)